MLAGAVCALAAADCFFAMAEGLPSLTSLGPTPTGLAASAFSDLGPLQIPVAVPSGRAAVELPRPAVVGPPASWRPLSPVEREFVAPTEADLFPLTRRAVPLLLPDQVNVSSQPPVPARAMNGPSVGVAWRIPGYVP